MIEFAPQDNPPTEEEEQDLLREFLEIRKKTGTMIFTAGRTETTPMTPAFYKNGEQCQGCGDSLWTNGQGAYDCKSCGGGLKPDKKVSKKSFAQGGETLHFKSQLGIQVMNPLSTLGLKINL